MKSSAHPHPPFYREPHICMNLPFLTDNLDPLLLSFLTNINPLKKGDGGVTLWYRGAIAIFF